MLKKYYHLAKPGIIYGNILNALAGFFLASRWQFEFGLLASTIGGMALVIASGCVFNNYLDRSLDAKMKRTKKRALVEGTISGSSAIAYATILGISGFAILARYTNALTVCLGLLAIFNYVVLYGFFKRRSVHGTVVGSVAGALPPVAAYSAVTNHLDVGAVILFFIYVFWQMPHFYAIGMYRFKDYKAAGLPILSVKKGMRASKVYILGYTAAFTVTSLLLTSFGYTGYAYLFVMAGIGLYWLVKGLKGFEAEDDGEWARHMFGTSLIVVMVLAVMLSVGPLLP